MGAPSPDLDRDLLDLAPEERWREWKLRVEAMLFASAEPVPREILAAVVGEACPLDVLLDDLREDLAERPYGLFKVAGGFHLCTRPKYTAIIRAAAVGGSPPGPELSRGDMLALMTVAYFQPVTRSGMADILGIPVSRDRIARLRHAGFVTAGPRSPEPGAPQTYVTTRQFLVHWGLDSLADLPERERFEAAGLLAPSPAGL